MPDPRIHPIERSDDYNFGVDDVSGLVIAANSQRADLEVTNDLDTVVYLSRSDPAAVGDGIRLNSNGGSYTMDTQNLYLGAFYAICNLGEDGNIAISEGEWQV
ncbi:unnamed protein product [marine sediment metagenome]|uniref:Uncharacterized protein n=1 Tax=marine sediment metagenome TaxID=412755 RepID=X0Z8K4_9ZZZZ